MTFPAHIEQTFQSWKRRKNFSEVEYLHARELIIKLAKIQAEVIRKEWKQQLKIAA